MKSRLFSLLEAAILALGAALAPVGPVLAHPHILASVQVDISFASNGVVDAVRQSWKYDPAYSAFAARQIDKNGDGMLSEEELAIFAKTQIEALREFGYFSALSANGAKLDFENPRDLGIVLDSAAVLTLSFTLPSRGAATRGKNLALEIFDEKFFAYFTMADEPNTVRLINAPDGCGSAFSGPEPVNLKEIRTVPAAFWAALKGSAMAAQQFVNRIVVTCP